MRRRIVGTPDCRAPSLARRPRRPISGKHRGKGVECTGGHARATTPEVLSRRRPLMADGEVRARSPGPEVDTTGSLSAAVLAFCREHQIEVTTELSEVLGGLARRPLPGERRSLGDGTPEGRRALAWKVLSEAIERYRRPDGYEGDLVEAAWQLEQVGEDAWPVLRWLAYAGIPECEYF